MRSGKEAGEPPGTPRACVRACVRACGLAHVSADRKARWRSSERPRLASRPLWWWAWYPYPEGLLVGVVPETHVRHHCLVNGADRGAWLLSKDASDRSIEAHGDGAANGLLGF